MSRKAHHSQLLATPPVRTISVTRFGVSAEKVVATMETPKSHQGMLRPERKKLVALLPACLDEKKLMVSRTTKKAATTIQSRVFSTIGISFLG